MSVEMKKLETVSFIIIRHRKENLKKCSLRGLEGRSDMLFVQYPEFVKDLPTLDHCVLLDMEGEPLSKEDCGPFVFLDATWKYATVMRENIPQLSSCRRRKIPDQWCTAYPRKQSECIDPIRGLATVEAIYAVSSITNTPMDCVLDHYHWKEQFLELNL